MGEKEFMQSVKQGTLNYYSAEHDSIYVEINEGRADLLVSRW